MQDRSAQCIRFSAFLLVFSFLCSTNAQLQTIRKSISILNNNYVDEMIIVNDTTKYVYNFTYPVASSENGPARITVEGFNAAVEYPIIVVVWDEKGVMSWQIPYTVGNVKYSKVSRIVCPQDNYNLSHSLKSGEMEDFYDTVFVSMTTAGKVNVAVRLQMNTNDVNDFFLELNQQYYVPPSDLLEFTPSEPWYYQYNWHEDKTMKRNITSVVLHVDARTGKDTCMTLSVQPISCPVLDTERTVGHDGYWQTIDWKGGFTINKDNFPNGFYVVFILNGNDAKCAEERKQMASMFATRNKTVKFSLTETIGIEKYYIAVLAPLLVYGGVCVCFFIGALVFCCRPYQKFVPTSSLKTSASETSGATVESQEPTQPNVQSNQETETQDPPLDEIGFDTVDPPTICNDIREKKHLFVSDLARKDAKILRRKSDMYVFQLFTVAVFYSLPVAQLMLSYQSMLHKTGNQDACFYNFLCSHPLLITDSFSISDFNHVFSNAGYVILGLLFCAWTFRRDTLHRLAVRDCPALDKVYGIPQHYGFFYAIGWALVMEGFLSASYHICPNQTNFQFDTSFMYITAVLCMVKLYHNRHPDINASAYTTFMTLALIIFFGMIGIIESSDTFFIVTSVIHLCLCLWLSLQVYNLGRGVGLTLDKSFLAQIKSLPQDVVDNPRQYLTPKYPNRLVFLTIGIVMNSMLVYVGWSYGLKKDFGSYLLTVLIANLMLYFLFYIIMKLINGEKLLVEPLLYSIISLCLAIPAGYFFYSRVTSWRDTPAVSRRGNRECFDVFSFYDQHDVWHFLSAGGMFCMFMVLLTLDDDLIKVPRSEIPVF